MKKILALLLLLLSAPAVAQQSAPNWSYGYTPTPAEWNHWFAIKSDWPGAAGCLVTACTMTGPIVTAPSTAQNAGFNIPPGTAPTTPNQGDMWSTVAPGLFIHLGTQNYNLLNPAHPPMGRITLQANTPVMTTTNANAGTLRYDCATVGDGGNGVNYYDGTGDQSGTITNCEVTDAMVSAATAGQVVQNNLYDLWWAHNGANHICLAMSVAVGGGGGWASDAGGSNTSRGTGYTQLDLVTRPYITNKNNITNCFNGATNYGTLLANQATYLGTIWATANGQTTYVFGGAAANGSQAFFGVCNPFNQVPVVSSVIDSAASYTYNSATIREAHGSTTMLVTINNCLGTNVYDLTYQSATTTAAVSGAQTSAGIGLDVTNAYSGPRGVTQTTAAVAMIGSPTSVLRSLPSAGQHFYAALEAADANTSTFNTDSKNTLSIFFMN